MSTNCVPTLCGSAAMAIQNCTSYKVCSSELEQIGYLYILPVICCIGIVHNCVILLVFSQSQFNSKMTSSTLTYLTGLAWADGLYCVFTLPEAFIRCVEAETESIQYFYNFYEEYIYYPVCGAVVTTSIWITFVLTIERFTFVTKSNGEVTGQSSMRSTKGAIYICVCTLILAILVYIPTFFFYDVTEEQQLKESEFGESVGYEIYSWIRMFVTILIPIVVVTVLNIALIRVTWASSKRCKVLVHPAALYTKRVKAQKKMTAMLLSISFTFVLCHVLKPLLNSRVHNTLFGGPCTTETAEFEQFRMVVISLEIVSCTSNYISYCIFNPHFVSTINNLFQCRRARIQPETRSTTNATANTGPVDDTRKKISTISVAVDSDNTTGQVMFADLNAIQGIRTKHAKKKSSRTMAQYIVLNNN